MLGRRPRYRVKAQNLCIVSCQKNKTSLSSSKAPHQLNRYIVDQYQLSITDV
jgi:hypothetical protein